MTTNTPMSAERLAELREWAEAYVYFYPVEHRDVSGCLSIGNQMATEAVPELLAEVEALRGERDVLWADLARALGTITELITRIGDASRG